MRQHNALRSFLGTLTLYMAIYLTFFHEPSVKYATFRSENGVISWDDKVILITGIAGFIGYSLASEIARKSNATIVGVDSFNDYYDVRLKYTRADLLSHYPHVRVIAGDVCNDDLMRELFQTYHFTHVVHLAAQAGVRYSLTKPFTYIRDNIQCFLNMLETLRYVATTNTSAPRFLYASSSSVYGANVPPFTEEDRVDSPTNLYSVTKLTNELIATAYHHLFDIDSIGLRFFTVYGPWGRPDMAPFIFTDSIERGVNITVFNDGKMARDFTYIDDIVSGIMLAMRYNVRSSTVFNLGNNKAEPVFELVRTIEEALGKRALVNFASSNTEIATTFACAVQHSKVVRPFLDKLKASGRPLVLDAMIEDPPRGLKAWLGYGFGTGNDRVDRYLRTFVSNPMPKNPVKKIEDFLKEAFGPHYDRFYGDKELLRMDYPPPTDWSR